MHTSCGGVRLSHKNYSKAWLCVRKCLLILLVKATISQSVLGCGPPAILGCMHSICDVCACRGNGCTVHMQVMFQNMLSMIQVACLGRCVTAPVHPRCTQSMQHACPNALWESCTSLVPGTVLCVIPGLIMRTVTMLIFSWQPQGWVPGRAWAP